MGMMFDEWDEELEEELTESECPENWEELWEEGPEEGEDEEEEEPKSEYPLQVPEGARQVRPVEVVALGVLEEDKELELLFWWEDCYCIEYDEHNRLFIYFYDKRSFATWSAEVLVKAILQRTQDYVQDAICSCERLLHERSGNDLINAQIENRLKFYRTIKERLPSSVIAIRWKDTKEVLALFNTKDLLREMGYDYPG